MGTVIAAKEVVLQPQVSGVIQTLHPALVPGGRIRAGAQVATIDRADYEVAVRQAGATLARAKAQLLSAELELQRIEGLYERQATNKKELDDARTVHAAATADVAAAQAALEKAQLDLARTVLHAPFNCVVVSETVDVGSLVTPQTQLATLVGTDEYWVRVAVPVDQLRWVHLPRGDDDAGAPARIHQRLGAERSAQWEARVIRLLGDLEPHGRMARLLLSVPDPLGDRDATSAQPPLLIGSYVDVVIEGRELRDVFIVRRDELRDGDTVWLMNEQDRLEVRDVDVAYRGRDDVLVRGGLTSGARLITSDLPAPVPDMPLRVVEPEPAATSPASVPAALPGGGGAP
jgi:RND family efflux transporter MFP subunit